MNRPTSMYLDAWRRLAALTVLQAKSRPHASPAACSGSLATAGATFTIYLLHLPVAQFLVTQVPWPAPSLQTRITLFDGTLLILFVIAQVKERRKELENVLSRRCSRTSDCCNLVH